MSFKSGFESRERESRV